MGERQTESDETTHELCLFPLNVVLLPGMTLSLRIFEERYKTMIGECLEASTPFGVVLIEEGIEVGGSAKPYQTGTTARITNVERLEGGRMNLSTTGERRFRIVDTVHELPYLKGRVRYLAEETGEIEKGLLDRARELFEDYVRGLAGLRSGWIRQAGIPEDARMLSYSIAEYLELPSKARQRLLELPLVAERLKHEVPLLEGAVQRVREQLVKRNPYQGPRLN